MEVLKKYTITWPDGKTGIYFLEDQEVDEFIACRCKEMGYEDCNAEARYAVSAA